MDTCGYIGGIDSNPLKQNANSKFVNRHPYIVGDRADEIRYNHAASKASGNPVRPTRSRAR